MGICSRQGLGKLRHIDTQTLWVQQRVRDKTFELRKVRGTENPADLFTKHLQGAAYIEGLLRLFGCVFRGGRPAAAPELRQGKGTQAGELLKAEMDPDVREGPVVWRNGHKFESVWHEAVEGVVPEAWSSAGELPHLTGSRLNKLFPIAEACEELKDVDPPDNDALEEGGVRLGQQRRRRGENTTTLHPGNGSSGGKEAETTDTTRRSRV